MRHVVLAAKPRRYPKLSRYRSKASDAGIEELHDSAYVIKFFFLKISTAIYYIYPPLHFQNEVVVYPIFKHR
jgi:hypothetical protein